MEQEYYNNNIFGGFNSGQVLVTNTTPSTITTTPILPAQLTINSLTSLSSILGLDQEVSSIFIGIVSTFMLCLDIKDYFKAAIIILICVFLCSNVIYGFVFACSVFAASKVANGYISYLTLLLITVIHTLVQSDIFGLNTNSSVPSNFNIDWLFMLVELSCLAACLVIPMFKRDKIEATPYPPPYSDRKFRQFGTSIYE